MGTDLRTDIRDEIFRSVAGVQVTAALIAEEEGMVTRLSPAAEAARELGLHCELLVEDDTIVRPGQPLLQVTGTPKAVVKAEEILIGMIAKPSGICTAARAALQAAAGKIEVVAGAWKKLPLEVRHEYRRLVAKTGIKIRISEDSFIYLDKNYVRIFGGVQETLTAVRKIKEGLRVVQIRGEYKPVEKEAVTAVLAGASIIMVDTGEKEDLRRVVAALTEKGLRHRVKVAFAGNIKIEDIPGLAGAGADILDIGTAIIDAPMLKVKFDVIHVE